MTSEPHNLDRRVRDYLLEFVNPGEMVAFEDRYFTDPEFLKLVEIEEGRLIEDYLLSRLDGASKARFEKVYMLNAGLARKVNASRERFRAAGRLRDRNRFWPYAFTATGLAACIALVVLVLIPKPPPKQSEAKLEMPAAPGIIDVRLSPGLSKGVGSAPVATVPSGRNRLRFIFEMPGVRGPLSCRVKLLRIESNGKRTEIAFSPLSTSSSGPNSEAAFGFDGIDIPKGDFVAELMAPDGVVLERYLFQAR